VMVRTPALAQRAAQSGFKVPRFYRRAVAVVNTRFGSVLPGGPALSRALGACLSSVRSIERRRADRRQGTRWRLSLRVLVSRCSS
jgi:hypothetical protein